MTGVDPRLVGTISLAEVIGAAKALHQAGRLAEASEIYRQVLNAVPGQGDALHLLGVVSLQQGDAASAVRLISEALRADPGNATANNSLGAALLALDRLEEAAASFDRAIAAQPGYVEALNNRGNALVRLERHREALESYDRAVRLGASNSTLHYNRAIALRGLGRTEEAIAACDEALRLEPAYADAHHNRGEALLALGRAAEALESYSREAALAEARPGAHVGRALALAALGRDDEAIAAFDRALALDPARVEALHPRGLALLRSGRPDEALASFERALAADPSHAGARYSRAVVLMQAGRLEEALHECALALESVSGDARVHFLRGVILAQLERIEEARDACARAIELDPGMPFAHGQWLMLRLRLCDWDGLDDAIESTLSRVRRDLPAADPFTLIAVPSTAADQLACARTFVAKRYPPNPLPAAPRAPRDRIRLGYLSSDFHDHATMRLLAEVLERHDRASFEVVAVSFGAETADDWRRRAQAAVDRFVDVSALSDDAIAARMRELGIDVAVDLKGYTTGSRTGILARRPAPVQVSYLGYPGTSGAPYIDYLVADRTVIGAGLEPCFSEAIAHLPHSYQPNLSSRPRADVAPARASLGLPSQGFVFCCFNNAYKILPPVFDAWMRLLKSLPGSVLWLLDSHPAASAALRRQAASRGVAPERLVFAPRIDNAAHLARHGAADLFLDTVPCNAHTTASDALWAGLPLVTVMGETFAGRVSASLLKAVGLPDLVAQSLAEYESLALRLGSDPSALGSLRARLAEGRSTQPLFDAAAYTRHLESAFATMWERHARGEPPATFDVPA